jgi:hypothetical protein
MATIRRIPPRASWMAAALLTALAATAVQAQTTLQWKFRKGETLNYQLTQKINVTMSVNNQNIKNNMVQTIDIIWTANDVTSDGTADLTQKIDRIQMTMDSPFGGKTEYDSKEGKKPEGPIGQQINPVLDAMVGAEFSFKMNRKGEVSDVKLPSKLVDALKNSPAMAQAGGMFSEDGMKNMITQSTLSFPAGPIHKGQNWSKTIEVPAGPLGTMRFDNTYTYEGPSSGQEKISLKSKMDLKPAENSPLEAAVKSQESEGSFLFDGKKGRLDESEVKQTMELSLKVQNMELVQTMEMIASMKLMGTK